MSVRVYVPGDWRGLAEQSLTVDLRGHVVTDGLRARLPDLDDEQLEHYVMTEAAQESLRHLAGEGEPRRRLVLVLDVDWVEPVPESLTGVRVRGPVVPDDVAAWLVDTESAAEDVDRATSALRSETGGEWSPGTTQAVEACLEHELAWYAATEADEVLALH